MTITDKARVNRARRAAQRQGCRLAKSTRRDPRAKDYGLYALTDAETGVAVAAPMTLTQVEARLERGRTRRYKSDRLGSVTVPEDDRPFGSPTKREADYWAGKHDANDRVPGSSLTYAQKYGARFASDSGHEDAGTAVVALRKEVGALLNDITTRVNDIDESAAHWGHVGDLGYIRELLRRAAGHADG